MSVKISVTGIDHVVANLKSFEMKTITNAVEACELTAAEMENHSKDHRPWTDRSGNARRSIYGLVQREEGSIIIYHGIGVYYGVFLELSHGGKYRVIGPTVDSFRSIWLRRLGRILR